MTRCWRACKKQTNTGTKVQYNEWMNGQTLLTALCGKCDQSDLHKYRPNRLPTLVATSKNHYHTVYIDWSPPPLHHRQREREIKLDNFAVNVIKQITDIHEQKH